MIIGIIFTGCSLKTKNNIIEDIIKAENIDSENQVELPKFIFASKDKAKELLVKEDEYLENFTEFDYKSKIYGEDGKISKYKELAKNSTRKWTAKEKKMINRYIEYINKRLKKLNINVNYPEKIYLIKSSCYEEGTAGGYTRHNYIVLNENSISLSLLSHELFHIISRYNKEKVEKFYNVIGFNKIKKDSIKFPEELKNRIISNPDATDLYYSINLKHKGKEKQGILVMYSDKAYNGGSFLDYITLGIYFPEDFIESEFKLKDLVSVNSVEGFFEQIGKNTNYIIHPEEISAEQFKLLILNQTSRVNNPELLEKLNDILSKK